MEIARIEILSRPLPEHAQRAIWEGRAARSREAASTDRGWASTLSLFVLVVVTGRPVAAPSGHDAGVGCN